MKRRPRTFLLAATALFLSACTTPAPRPDMAPAPAPTTSKPEPELPVRTVPARPGTPVRIDAWGDLRDRFAMNDCPAPAVRRARLETRNPAGFEARLHAALPVIDYVSRVAAAKQVAGEFALLPWVESHFRDVAPRRGRPAGMWQIMAITARALELPVNRGYDGRLDRVASSDAALQLIADYHAHWGDWRVADMAYNTGEFRMRKLLKAHGMPKASPAIPNLPVGRTTRQHLTRLLAIACIVRDPARFNVTLPKMEPQRRLKVVELDRPARVSRVASASGMSTQAFRELNPGYRLDTITTTTPMRVLLPVAAAQRLDSAIAGQALEDGDALASVDSSSRYTVASGDSLWSIARRFDVRVEQLRAWNDLDGSDLRPGQVLMLEPAPSG